MRDFAFFLVSDLDEEVGESVDKVGDEAMNLTGVGGVAGELVDANDVRAQAARCGGCDENTRCKLPPPAIARQTAITTISGKCDMINFETDQCASQSRANTALTHAYLLKLN